MTSALLVHRVRLTKAGWYWLAVIAGLIGIALLKNINLLLVVGCFAVLLLAVNWVHVRRSLRHLHTTLHLPEDAFVGSKSRLTVNVANKRMLGVHRLVGQLQWAGSTSTSHVFSIVGKSTTNIVCQIVPGQRGVFQIAVWTVRHSYPFGLVESVRQETSLCQTWAYPARGEFKLRRLLRGFPRAAAIRGQRRMMARQLNDGTDLHGLRPFRAGDSPRWIHWRTTARVGAPMIRELDRTAGAGLIAVADIADSTIGHAEATLAMLATLVVEWVQDQDGRLTIAFTTKSGWRRVDLQHRRGAVTALRALCEWPVSTSASQCWSASDFQSNSRRAPIVAVVPSKVLPAGLVGKTISLDPTVTSQYYQPPGKFNV